ncbi:MAG: MotA/TolQ/ExbB proton channel family protein [Luteolibacter sp.]
MIEILNHHLAFNPSSGLYATWEFLHKGGKFMIPLAITSVAGMMAVLYKLLSLSSNRVIPKALARDVARFQERINSEGIEPVLREFEKGESTLARLASVVIKHRGKPRSEITHAVESAAREETMHLHAGIAVLDTVITIAPLLGLLGTASGLVLIFQGLGDNSDHLAIARGIAEALTTTIFGLAIAVPCVVAHGYFVRRIETLTARLEALLGDLAVVCEKPNPNA